MPLGRAQSLLVLAAFLGGCALSGGSSGRMRLGAFYLTKESVQGNRALGACARGFHMASRFEIWDVTSLTYDDSRGVTTEDSGSGPPSVTGRYGSESPSGWVRTGGGSQFSDSDAAAGAAFTNCAAWATNSAEAYGTVAFLTDRFPSPGTAGMWSGGSEHCDVPHHVWCVTNPGNPGPEPEPDEHRHRHRSEP
jgi:hypothetical protein